MERKVGPNNELLYVNNFYSYVQKKVFTQQGCIRQSLAVRSQPSFVCALIALSTLRCDVVMCVCVSNGCILLQHCDKVIPLEYPDKAKEKTIFTQVIITSDKVNLGIRETTWKLFMDRSEVSVCAMGSSVDDR